MSQLANDDVETYKDHYFTIHYDGWATVSIIFFVDDAVVDIEESTARELIAVLRDERATAVTDDFVVHGGMFKVRHGNKIIATRTRMNRTLADAIEHVLA